MSGTQRSPVVRKGNNKEVKIKLCRVLYLLFHLEFRNKFNL